MRSLIIVLLLASGGVGCSSGGIDVDQDAGVLGTGDGIADAGVTSGLVRLDGNSSVINLPGCAPSGGMTSCQATDTHYAFDRNQGKCVAVSGCDAMASLFDTLTSCEAKCSRYLMCSCDSAAETCNSAPGACGTCPVLSMDSFLPDSKAIIMSGQTCTYAGLTCYMSYGASSGLQTQATWMCSCGTDGNWICVTPPSGCQLC